MKADWFLKISVALLLDIEMNETTTLTRVVRVFVSSYKKS